jgi:hypothetical protein
MGEFLAAMAQHKMMSGGGKGGPPDMSQPAQPQMQPMPSGQPAQPPMQPQPGFSAGSGVPQPQPENAMAHPATSLMDTVSSWRNAPHDYMQGVKSSALDALAKMFM